MKKCVTNIYFISNELRNKKLLIILV